MRSVKLVILALLAMALVAGCGAKPASIDIEPGSVTLKTAGATYNLAATVKDSKGQAIEKHEPVVWQSSDTAVATVSGTGVVKAVGSGKAEITAMTGEAQASIPVTVRIVASVTVHPGKALIDVGESKDFDAIVKDEKGNVLTGESVKWSVGDAGVASVSDTGTAKGKSKGSTSVRASVESVSDKAELTVKEKDDMVVKAKPGAEDKKLDKKDDKKDDKEKSKLKPKMKEGNKDKKLKK